MKKYKIMDVNRNSSNTKFAKNGEDGTGSPVSISSDEKRRAIAKEKETQTALKNRQISKLSDLDVNRQKNEKMCISPKKKIEIIQNQENLEKNEKKNLRANYLKKLEFIKNDFLNDVTFERIKKQDCFKSLCGKNLDPDKNLKLKLPNNTNKKNEFIIELDNKFENNQTMRKFFDNSKKYIHSLKNPLQTQILQENFEGYMNSLWSILNFNEFPKSENIKTEMKDYSLETIHLEKRGSEEFQNSQVGKESFPKNLHKTLLSNAKSKKNKFFLTKPFKFKSQERNIIVMNNEPLQTNLENNAKSLEQQNQYLQINKSLETEHRLDSNIEGYHPFKLLHYLDSTNDREENEDLDNLRTLDIFSKWTEKKRLFHLDPKHWKFKVSRANRDYKNQTASEDNYHFSCVSPLEALNQVLAKLWWEEYIPFYLFNHLTSKEK